MSFLKPIDPVYFHHDVLNALDSVNGLRPKTLLGTLFVKKPAQLCLTCFSSVLSVTAAVREAFIALAAFFAVTATFLYSKTRALLQKHYVGEVKGWDTCKLHTYRAGCQLLGLPISLAAIPGIFYNTFGWVIRHHIKLHNYARREERVVYAAPPVPVAEAVAPAAAPSAPAAVAPAPSAPPLPRRSEPGIPPPPPLVPARAPEAAAVIPSPAPLEAVSPSKPAAKKKGVKFDSVKAAQPPAAEPKLKQSRSRDFSTVKRKLKAGVSVGEKEPPEVFVEKATYNGNKGWYATNLSLNYLSEQIEGFKIDPKFDQYDLKIDNLFEYIKTALGIGDLEQGKTYTLGTWNIYIENLAEANEASYPKVFIYESTPLQQASKRREAANQTIKSPEWSDSDSDEEVAQERAQASSQAKKPTSRPSVTRVFSNEDVSAPPTATPALPATPVIKLMPGGRPLPTPKEAKRYSLTGVDEKLAALAANPPE